MEETRYFITWNKPKTKFNMIYKLEPSGSFCYLSYCALWQGSDIAYNNPEEKAKAIQRFINSQFTQEVDKDFVDEWTAKIQADYISMH